MKPTALLLSVLSLALAGCGRTSPPTIVTTNEPPVPAAAVETPGPVVVVRASYPGADAPTLDATVTVRLLEEIDGAEGLVRLEAESRDGGSCVILARFSGKTDSDAALALIQKRLQKRVALAKHESPRARVTIEKGNPADGRDGRVRLALTDPLYRHPWEGPARKWAEAVANRLVADGLAAEAAVEPRADAPRPFFEINREKLKALALAMADVVSVLEEYPGARAASELNPFARPDRVEIPDPSEVKPAGYPFPPGNLDNTFLRNAGGELVPLSAFVRLRGRTASVLRVGKPPALRVVARPPVGKKAADVLAKCIEVAEAERKRLGLQPDPMAWPTYEIVNLTGE
jgi:multidrug efflux pump subunit AcrB